MANGLPLRDDNGSDRPSRVREFLRPEREGRRTRLRVEIAVLVIGLTLVLVGAWLVPQDFGNDNRWYLRLAWSAFMVRVLHFHIGLMLLVVALLAAAMRAYRLALIAVPAIVLTVVVPLTWGTWHSAPASKGPPLRVMSINLLVGSAGDEQVLDDIDDARPDVLVLQEYDDLWHDSLHEALSDDYPHFKVALRGDSFGLGVYSRTPLTEPDDGYQLTLGDGTLPQFRVRMQHAGSELTIYAVHLLPPIGLDYTAETRRQFADLVDNIEQEGGPVIVAGDLNATEATPHHAALADAGMSDAWSLAGSGRGSTWPATRYLRLLPGLRLDHVYVSRDLTVTRVRTGNDSESDHRPVTADVALRR